MTAAVATMPITLPSRNGAMLRSRAALREVARTQRLCSTCAMRVHCLSAQLDAREVERVDEMVTTRMRLRKGETLYRAGAPFTSLYAVHAGSFKTVLLAEDGRDQVASYHMAGEVLGLDGIGNDVHPCQAVALEDSEVCVLPFDRVENLARDCAGVQHNVYRFLSLEIARQRQIMLLLGTMRADQRLATFLLDLSKRYEERGYSASEFVLRMTREEIGSYLGLKLETVSRLLSRLQQEGLIQVQGRVVKLLERAGLKQLVGHAA